MTPKARAAPSGRRRARALRTTSVPWRSRALNALRFGLANLELFHHCFPVAPLAEQPLHELAEGAVAAARGELPGRRGQHFGRGVRGRGGDAGVPHRREVGEVVAEVHHFVQAQAELAHQPFAGLELVRRTLVDLGDAELARAALECVRAARGQQGHGHPDLLRQLDAEAVANVELLDLAMLARVDDPAVRPYAVDVGDDEADGERGGEHRGEGYRLFGRG